MLQQLREEGKRKTEKRIVEIIVGARNDFICDTGPTQRSGDPATDSLPSNAGNTQKKNNVTHSHTRTHMNVYRQHKKLFSVESCRGRSQVYFVVVYVVVAAAAAACVACKCVRETDINILTYVCHGKLEDATANVLEKLAFISPF